jgi:hypothetical protein
MAGAGILTAGLTLLAAKLRYINRLVRYAGTQHMHTLRTATATDAELVINTAVHLAMALVFSHSEVIVGI